jgi:hypothetical protein
VRSKCETATAKTRFGGFLFWHADDWQHLRDYATSKRTSLQAIAALIISRVSGRHSNLDTQQRTLATVSLGSRTDGR